METPHPIPHQPEETIAEEREDNEADRRLEQYRQRYEHSGSGFIVAPEQGDPILPRRALSDGYEPDIAFGIVSAKGTHRTFKAVDSAELADRMATFV